MSTDFINSESTHALPTSRDPFEHRYGAALPAGLRDEAARLSWDMFDQIYSPRAGKFRLENWQIHNLGSAKIAFEATIRTSGSSNTYTAMSSGPIGALTGMLYKLGCNLEIRELHQRPVDDRTATFVLGECDEHQAWGVAFSADPVESSLRAVIAAANRL
ncbi:2-isopropylmalate synthase [Hoyosella rhizosphaerae]|uniref:2-isopropylmalate synthase LeuA allosteric (dimerisation) domain-containing protein n=1 Tax=Hoyosella rhizosphaerae TaxID=1755582 RepID=A0A916U844_9ACTN|nr:alpha-isopropylmalate synthase regulatory domain-containing protein [Hoyosella rhizosphaerae]MBN4927723.1 2-isopropylmalate synthase [Hoyosella rhizosphaerae]GGC62086.1 hypothetical protein GCM10011410_13200 [Hoyosella rhizosphaerae]